MHCRPPKTYFPLPCINCARGRRKDLGEWICSQDGFRPRPISEIHNCKALNEYREKKKGRLNSLPGDRSLTSIGEIKELEDAKRRI